MKLFIMRYGIATMQALNLFKRGSCLYDLSDTCFQSNISRSDWKCKVVLCVEGSILATISAEEQAGCTFYNNGIFSTYHVDFLQNAQIHAKNKTSRLPTFPLCFCCQITNAAKGMS